MPSSLEKKEHVRPVDETLWRNREIRISSAQLSIRQPAVDILRSARTNSLSSEVCSDERSGEIDLAPKGEGAADPFNVVMRQQLSRMLQSKTFVQSDKLSRFLRFIVEHVIDGNPGCLKEYVIGVEVYDRKPPYHPSQDSIVRTEARRLRGKLKEYYEAEGKEEPIFVYLRPGSYVPVFQSRKDLIGTRSLSGPAKILLRKPSSIAIAILPFRDISENQLSATFARGISDELGYALMLTYGCTVISPSLVACTIAREHDLEEAMSKVGAQLAYEGSVRVQGTLLRVTARIIDATGHQLWVKRIDADTASETPFAVEEQVASALSAGFDVLFVQSPQRHA